MVLSGTSRLTCRVVLAPRFASAMSEATKPSVRSSVTISFSAAERLIWHQALVLRKYVTLASERGYISTAELAREFTAANPSGSECWITSS